MPPEPTIEALLARNAELEAKVKALEQSEARNAELEAKVKLLEQKLDLLVRKIFGKKSEQLDAEQRALFDEALDADLAAAEAQL